MKPALQTARFALFLSAMPLAAALAQTKKPAPKPATRTTATTTTRTTNTHKTIAAKPAAPAPAERAAPAPAPAPAPAVKSARATASGDSSFGVGTNALNLGIGLGSRYSYGLGKSSVTPAFSASFERGILALGPGVLGVGGIIGYQSATYDYSGYYSSGTYKDKYTDLIVMVRGAFHYPVTPQFDAYAGVGVGLRYLGFSTTYNGPDPYNYGYTGATSGLFVGGRYYFTSNIGAFAELGYDQTYLKAGLAMKF